MPKSQGVHALYFNAMMNTKISSSGACTIYLRVVHYCLVQFVLVPILFNIPVIMTIPRIHLFNMSLFSVLEHQMMNISSK